MNRNCVPTSGQHPMLGITLMLLVYFLFSCVDVSAKWLALAGIPALQTAFMRYLGSFVISAGIILKNGGQLHQFSSPHIGLVILRSLLLTGSTVLNFIALQYIPLSITSTIMFAAPIIVCALSGPLLGEHVGKWRWISIFSGFIGVIIAIRPFNTDFHWALLLSLATVTMYSLYTILTRKLANQVPTVTLQFYVSAVGSIVLLPLGLYLWETPSSSLEWFLLLVIGSIAWLGHELLTGAHSISEASALTPYAYVFIIYMIVWGYLIFGDVPDSRTMLGATVVVASGLLIWLRERKHGAANAFRFRG